MLQAGVILSDYATLMVEILKDNARPEAGEVYGAIDIAWAKLVGQIAQACGGKQWRIEMDDRELIEIPLDDRDAELLPAPHEYFKAFWSDTSEEPRAKYNRFMSNTPIVDGVVFRPVAGSAPWGYGANR